MSRGLLFLLGFFLNNHLVLGNTFTHIQTCDKTDPISVFKRITAKSRIHCAVICEKYTLCQSVQYDNGICYLNDARNCFSNQTNSTLVYYLKNIICQNGGYLLQTECRCINGYVGAYCERLMYDCSEGYASPHGYTESKVFDIQPLESTSSFQVYCKMMNGGRTLFQVHRKPSVSFNMTWVEYRDGFGSLTSDHWLGLEKMRLITSNDKYQLIVYMRIANGSFFQHYFDDFHIENESNLYRLNFSTASPHSVHPLGDSLTESKGMTFSTYDQDNDKSTSNCANTRRSGWWFNNCGPCNPNGEILKPADSQLTTEYEMFWTHDLQNIAPIKSEMWFVQK